jgi:hypothetical protein
MKNNTKKILLRLPAELEKQVLAYMALHPEITTFTQALLRLIAEGLEKRENK